MPLPANLPRSVELGVARRTTIPSSTGSKEVRAWPKPCAFAEILGNHHLALGAYSLSHTASVYLTQFLV